MAENLIQISKYLHLRVRNMRRQTYFIVKRTENVRKMCNLSKAYIRLYYNVEKLVYKK